jgi:hypothetical protein
MAMLPAQFSQRLFEILERGKYIDRRIHHPVFWPTASVCLSSNDSAMDIQFVGKKIPEKRWRVIDAQDVYHFDNAPRFWGLNTQTSFVKVGSGVWAEIGPLRKGPADKDGPICDDVERMLLIQTENGFKLTFTSLYGTDVNLARQKSSGSWEVRVCMQARVTLLTHHAGLRESFL